jgi:hypothetical protein
MEPGASPVLVACRHGQGGREPAALHLTGDEERAGP